ncbi:MAG: hypothetical protein QOJ19_550 [Acidimicrobiia bacterium]|jgi:hypothetical protein|nr:hypothetical protein [Acidimicrobiia bacterium]
MLLRRSLVAAGALAGLGVGTLEARYRRHPGNDLSFTNEAWSVERKAPEHLRFGARVIVHNEVFRREVMLADARAEARLLSAADVDDLQIQARVHSGDTRYPPRPDGFWVAFAVKPGKYGKDSPLDVSVDVTGPSPALDELYGAWVRIDLLTYGFEGNRRRAHHLMFPLTQPDPADAPSWRELQNVEASVRPIRTHLLGPFDDPVEIVRRYAVPHAARGDIVTLCESPLAAMQGRFYDPAQLKPAWAATRLAQFMSGEGSLGTATGMQTLVNEAGALRVFGALVGGAAAKVAGRAGWFYRLAGPQARLIDDLPENIPPYDKFILDGPAEADEVCAGITQGTGLAAAIVDANNLGKVDVIGRTPGVSDLLVKEALRSNPAGNADESTPLVLIRPKR